MFRLDGENATSPYNKLLLFDLHSKFSLVSWSPLVAHSMRPQSPIRWLGPVLRDQKLAVRVY